MNSRHALRKWRQRKRSWCAYITTARHEKSAILHAISIQNLNNKCTRTISPHCRLYAFWCFILTCNSAQSELLGCGCISENSPPKSVLIPNGFCTSDFLTNYVGNSSISYACHMLYTTVSEPLWDRGPVNSFFIRRGPGPNKFTRKYLSIFLSSYIKLTKVLIINYGIIIKSIRTLMYTVWHVDKYKITFKLVINHWTNEIL